MEREKISILDHGTEIINGIKNGAFLTTKVDDKINSMVIEWGTIGMLWGKQVFICYVRESRFTRELLDKNPEFTINIPIDDYDKNILKICGTKSGRDMDKIKETGLTPIEGNSISVPAFKELPMTIECKVIYRQEQNIELIPSNIKNTFYRPREIVADSNQDEHITYIGEIIDSYILK